MTLHDSTSGGNPSTSVHNTFQTVKSSAHSFDSLILSDKK